jgi:PAS domain S-box-containing protein
VSIAIFDRNMRFLATSNRWHHDYARGYAELVGRSLYEVYPDYPPSWKIAHERGLAGESVKNEEDLFVPEEGVEIWTRWAVVPWLDGERNVGGIIITVEDITERKLADRERERQAAERVRAMEAVVASEQKYSAIFKASPIARALIRLSDRIVVDVNDAFLACFEVQREDALGKTATELLGLADEKSLAHVSAELHAQGQLHAFDCVRETKSGARRVLSLNLDALEIGGQPHMLMAVLDVTAREEAVAARRENEETARLARALHEANDDLNRAQAVSTIGSWRRADLRNTELQWSDEMRRIFGVPSGLPITTRHSSTSFIRTIAPS